MKINKIYIREKLSSDHQINIEMLARRHRCGLKLSGCHS